jgi:hypothetical protein
MSLDLKSIDQGITTKAFITKLRNRVAELGGPTAAAKVWGVWQQQVTNATSGDKLPTRKIVEGMGYESVKEIRYRYKEL